VADPAGAEAPGGWGSGAQKHSYCLLAVIVMVVGQLTTGLPWHTSLPALCLIVVFVAAISLIGFSAVY
jgi:hypothetical protein